ncbi:MAG TPA: DUF1598 domain-containing protein [Planctomycetaceae bacterium]|nr:DUF1598 domain-containing protein [Planctomycetaceae bacterium]
MVRGQRWLRLCSATLLLASASGVFAAEADPAARALAHLAAGEFGPAAEQAAAIVDPAEQAKLLRQIAAAQQGTGATQSARATRQRISNDQARTEAQNRATQEQSLAGGGVIADFSSLMQLIQENTSGQWELVDGVGGTMTPFPTGVRVSPQQMLNRVLSTDTTGKLAALKDGVRQADLNTDMAQTSSMRLVSLARLEREVARRLADGLAVPESMMQLAGLSKIQYVFLDKDEGDIIVGGPAEAWQYNAQGQPLGVSSKRPTLQLDDFVTVLRTFTRNEADFGCSINTREENVKSLQAFAQQSQAKGPLSAGAGVRSWVNQLQKKLGQQDIVVWGVPGDSRVARVIVEADYRMKLIGIDKLDAGKEIPSYFDLLPKGMQKNPPPMEALRWWLSMKYDAVTHSPDRGAFEIVGSSVLCQSENQMLTADGKHLPTGQSEPLNRQFAENFTQNYGKLADRDMVFADMQNVFDMALVAALIRHERLADRAAWDLGTFANNGTYQPAIYAVPKEVDSVVNHKVYNGRDVVVQVAGGVRADVVAVVKDPNLAKEAPQLTAVAKQANTPKLPAGRWWWDAAK